MLEKMRNAFKLGQVDTLVLAKLINFRFSRLDDFTNNDTKLLSFQEGRGDLLFHFSVPKRDKQVKVLKIFPFREYLDGNRFKVYGGPRYIMANTTNNCTRFVDTTDGELPVRGSCMEAGSNVDYYENEYWAEVEYSSQSKVEIMEPTIYEIDLYWAVQCYTHNITVRHITHTCGKTPVLISMLDGFMIEDLNFGYDKKNLTFEYDLGSSEVIFTPKNVHDTWRRQLEIMVENLHAMKVINSDIGNLASFGIAGPIDNYWILAGCGLFIVVVILVVHCHCRRDPIRDLIELKILSDIARSAPNLRQMESFDAELRRAKSENTIPSISDVTIGSTGPCLYPTLSRSVRFLERLPTPFPSAPNQNSAPSSWNTIIDGLKPAPIEPRRFTKQKMSSSIMSVPAYLGAEIMFE